MNRTAATANLLISSYYLYNIVLHMIQPGMDTDYTRMLMFVCLATIPLSFMMVMVGSSSRLSSLPSQVQRVTGSGPLYVLSLAGFGFIMVLMPAGMLLAVWFGMGLRLGLLFALYFIPLLLRLALAPPKASVTAAITRVVTLFASFFTGLFIVWFLESFSSGAAIYQQHLQLIWPDYPDAAKFFFSVCMFAILNQALEFRHALLTLFSGLQARASGNLKPQP